MSPARSVLCIGEVLIDIIVSDGSTSLIDATSFVARPGGAPANVAVALARLGQPAAFCGAVGDDPFGQRLQNVLRANDVDIDHLAVIPDESTTLAFAWKNERGDGEFRILRLADTELSPEIVDAAGIADRAAIIVGSVVLTAPGSRAAIYRAVDVARAAGVPVCFDVNIRPALWHSRQEAMDACQPVLDAAAMIKLSLDDSAFLFGLDDPDAVFALEMAGDPIRLVTDGARGAWFRSRHGFVEHVAAFPVDLVEPTGAGDAFTAAIVSRFLETGRSPDRSDVEFASAAGAITATRVGAIESLPTLAEIEQFLASR